MSVFNCKRLRCLLLLDLKMEYLEISSEQFIKTESTDGESAKSRMEPCDVRDGRSKLFCKWYYSLFQRICVWLQL